MNIGGVAVASEDWSADEPSTGITEITGLLPLIDWVGVSCPVSTLAAIRDAHVKDVRRAVCGSSP